jgi:hypothetical protein
MEPKGPRSSRSPRGAKAAQGESVPQPAAENAVDPARVQTAAVAAQQAALTEVEVKLVERRAALEKQEEQLATHLEEQRLALVQLKEQTQLQRAALDRDRLAFERRMRKMSGDLAAAQGELANSQQLVQDQRGWLATQAQALADKRLRFHTHYELGRCRLREAWQRLRQDQFRWKHRRGQERAALKVRRLDIEAAQQRLAEAQRLFAKEKRAWEYTRAVLQSEIDGLGARNGNLRAKILEQQNESARLDATIRAARQQDADTAMPTAPPHPEPALAGVDEGRVTNSVAGAEVLRGPGGPPGFGVPQPRPSDAEVPRPEPTGVGDAPPHPAQPVREGLQRRIDDLDSMAGDLADQRRQLVEHWHQLGHFQLRWEAERQQASRELEELARRLVDNGHLLSQREHAGLQADHVLRQRHEELVQIRRETIAWRARLRVREGAWEGERNRLLIDVRGREELAERHLRALVDVRQRWATRRRDELEKLLADQQALETARREQSRQRLALADQTTALEGAKRILAEKCLALEQYRREFLTNGKNPTAPRRLERLRRRWITLNASAIRAAARERESLKAVLLILDERFGELQKRAELLGQAEADLVEKQTSWEHKRTLHAARQGRIQHELQSAEAQRKVAGQEVARMKEEIERIARALIDEPDPPVSEALTQAA